MNKRIILHIGFPRCGSTLIQEILFKYLNSDVKFIAPSTEDRQIIDFLNNNFILSGRNIKTNPVKDAEIDLINNIMEDYKEETILISCEGLVGDSFDNMLPMPHLIEALLFLFQSPEILLLIRRQDHLIQSYYRFAVEEGLGSSFSNFIGYTKVGLKGFRLLRNDGINVDPRSLNYKNIIEYLYNSFGKEKVHVIPIELLFFSSNEFFIKLFSLIGVSELTKVANLKVVNKGLTNEEIILIRLLNNLWKSNIFGFQIFPMRPFYNYLCSYGRECNLIIRIIRSCSARISPIGVYRTLKWIYIPILWLVKTLGISKGVFPENALCKILAANAESNKSADQYIGGILKRFGYYE